MDDAARAFVPGHVTGFFTVDRDDDPTRAGSTGAGVALADGVTVEVGPATETTIRLNGEGVEIESVERVLAALSVRATVEGETPLPVGAGFGVSGAMALGTALAANDLFETGLSENELITIAHGAEVQAGTGLGDVVAQARGGLPIRLEPGGPHHGKLDGVPVGVGSDGGSSCAREEGESATEMGRIEYVSFGELPTADVIEGETETLTQAGEDALSRLVRHPTVDRFMFASRRFAREAGLLTASVKRAIEAVNEADGEAAMAMLGDSVFALGTGLSDAGYDPAVTAVHPCGATLR